MKIQFKRSRLQAILDALQSGRCIYTPLDGDRWDDNELLAVAGACMSELMVRREVAQVETTDEPLQHHLEKPFDRLSPRLTAALNYVLYAASTLTNGCVVKGDRTYKVEIVYHGPEFLLLKPSKVKPKNRPPAPDDTPPQDESDDTVMLNAA